GLAKFRRGQVTLVQCAADQMRDRLVPVLWFGTKLACRVGVTAGDQVVELLLKLLCFGIGRKSAALDLTESQEDAQPPPDAQQGQPRIDHPTDYGYYLLKIHRCSSVADR